MVLRMTWGNAQETGDRVQGDRGNAQGTWGMVLRMTEGMRGRHKGQRSERHRARSRRCGGSAQDGLGERGGQPSLPPVILRRRQPTKDLFCRFQAGRGGEDKILRCAQDDTERQRTE